MQALPGGARSGIWTSHLEGSKDERSTPVISFDYCFISDHGDIETVADVRKLIGPDCYLMIDAN